MAENTERKEKSSLCPGWECEIHSNWCCRDCPERYVCAEVCDGPEGSSIDGHCEFRI